MTSTAVLDRLAGLPQTKLLLQQAEEQEAAEILERRQAAAARIDTLDREFQADQAKHTAAVEQAAEEVRLAQARLKDAIAKHTAAYQAKVGTSGLYQSQRGVQEKILQQTCPQIVLDLLRDLNSAAEKARLSFKTWNEKTDIPHAVQGYKTIPRSNSEEIAQRQAELAAARDEAAKLITTPMHIDEVARTVQAIRQRVRV